MQKFVFSVTQINNHIKNILESDLILSDVWICGELSNVRVYAQGGQVYFTLSDGTAQINAVIYESFLPQIKFKLTDGLKVVAKGKIKTFAKKGSYILQVAYLGLEGAGGLAKEFEMLKAKLLAEGLFDQERKKEIPKFVQKIGLVTAVDSAAMWDYITISKKLAPHLELFVLPAVMQGAQSAASVMAALDLAEAFGQLDVVIILRGGGASEDLASFNNEQLVRRVAACAVPVISAIGHEVDYTLTDFVADLRLPTPTAAAQKVAEPYVLLRDYLQDLLQTIPRQLRERILEQQEYVADLLSDIKCAVNQNLSQVRQKVDGLTIRLEQANPLHKLKQGYTITRLLESKSVVKSIKQAQTDNVLVTQVFDGEIYSKVIDL